jgi:hypothetical protein
MDKLWTHVLRMKSSIQKRRTNIIIFHVTSNFCATPETIHVIVYKISIVRMLAEMKLSTEVIILSHIGLRFDVRVRN